MDIGTLSLGGALSPITRVRRLFTAGEKGVWYDPSDIGTLFQDSAGTTPVTAVTQPVGLMLDKSNGLVLGPELMPGLTTSGWVLTNCTLAVVGNELEITATSTGLCYASYNVATGSTNKFIGSYRADGSGAAAGIQVADTVSFTLSPTTTSTSNSSFTGFYVSTGLSCQYRVRITATAIGQKAYFSNMSDKALPGYHATQATSTARPTLQQDANGKFYLKFDGVDDFMVTPSIDFSGTDKMSVFVGVRKLSDATGGAITELSASISTNAGGFLMVSGALLTTDRQNFASQLGGTAVNWTELRTYTSPYTAVLSSTFNIGATGTANENSARINGGTATTTNNSPTDAGTGNFGNYPLYIGMRGGTTLPFNGHLYSLVVRGALSDAAQISATETYINSRTGAY